MLKLDFLLCFSLESGEVFGWGNSEYMQFNSVCEEKQLCIPTHVPVSKVTGKVIRVAAGGTNCGVINGNAQNSIVLESFLLICSFY